MKARLTILKFVIVFGQSLFTWTSANPAQSFAGDLGNGATNYNPNGIPSSKTGPDANNIFGDIIEWNGTPGNANLMITANTGQTGGSGNPVGLRFHLTSAQTGSVKSQ